MKLISLFFLIILFSVQAFSSERTEEVNSASDLVDKIAVLRGAKLCSEPSYINCFGISRSMCKANLKANEDVCLGEAKVSFSIAEYELAPVIIINPYIECLLDKHAFMYEKNKEMSLYKCLEPIKNNLSSANEGILKDVRGRLENKEGTSQEEIENRSSP